jgi:hypothetical protein
METIKFDPNIAELQLIVAATSKITADDLSNDAQLALVHDTRISLRDARVKIEKAGKAMRADALKYQKDVVAREKELIAIIEPEEMRLKVLEDNAAALKERAAHFALLPMRREQLTPFGFSDVDEAFILDMDNDEFVAHLVKLQAEKNERDRLELEAEKTRLADEARIAQVKKDAEVAERNRIEEANRINEQVRINAAAQEKLDAANAAQKLLDDAKAEAERIKEAAEYKVAQEEAQREAAEREARIRKEQREADERYQAWLGHIGWKREESDLWIITESGRAYKYVDTFKK